MQVWGAILAVQFRGPSFAVHFLEVIDFKRSHISGGLRFQEAGGFRTILVFGLPQEEFADSDPKSSVMT